MCENCKSWVREFNNDFLFSEHHPDCEFRDIEQESKTHLVNLLNALEHEAKMGDGISEEFYDSYKEAKYFITGGED